MSAKGQCRRFQHAVAWSALPPGADPCDSERLFGNVSATDLYRQFVFAWEQTVVPRSEPEEVADRNLRITWA